MEPSSTPPEQTGQPAEMVPTAAPVDVAVAEPPKNLEFTEAQADPEAPATETATAEQSVKTADHPLPTPNEQAQQAPSAAAKPAADDGAKKPAAAIIIVVVIFVVLAAVAYYAFTKSR